MGGARHGGNWVTFKTFKDLADGDDDSFVGTPVLVQWLERLGFACVADNGLTELRSRPLSPMVPSTCRWLHGGGSEIVTLSTSRFFR